MNDENVSDPVGPDEGFFDHRIGFVNHAGRQSSPLEMVVPIGFFDPTIELFHPFATGVFVSEVGLVCTAEHVFQFEPQFIESMKHLSKFSFLAVYQFDDKHHSYIRPIIAVHPHEKFDLTIARLEPSYNQKTGEAFRNKMMACTTDILPLDTVVHQYSYPDPVVFAEPTPEGTQLLMIPLHTKGKIIDWFPEGMGKLFPSPCYVIEGYIGAGSSGGPVMDETGRVFAISSRGNAADDYYYAVPVKQIADIIVSSVMLSSPPEIMEPTIRQMAARGLMSFVELKKDDNV